MPRGTACNEAHKTVQLDLEHGLGTRTQEAEERGPDVQSLPGQPNEICFALLQPKGEESQRVAQG